MYDVNASAGGPIKKDKLWLFGSYRNVGNDNIVANSFYPDGSPGIYDQRVHNYTARLTWQVNERQQVHDLRRLPERSTSGTCTRRASTWRPPRGDGRR